MVEQVFEAAAAPPEFLSQASAAIWERSCGLPLFVEQMAVHLHQVTPCSWPFTAPSPRLASPLSSPKPLLLLLLLPPLLSPPPPPLLLLLLLLPPSLRPICGCIAGIADILLRLTMTLCGRKDEKHLKFSEG